MSNLKVIAPAPHFRSGESTSSIMLSVVAALIPAVVISFLVFGPQALWRFPELLLEAAEERLRQGQRELAQFISAVQKVCSQEMKFLEELPQLPANISAPSVAELRESAAVSSAGAPAEGTAAPEEPAVPAPEPPPVEIPPVAAVSEDSYPEGDPFAKEPEEAVEATRRIKFDKLDDLKFGPNYTSGI